MKLNKVAKLDRSQFDADHGNRPKVTDIIGIATRSDGYRFYLTVRHGEPRIYAGCRKAYRMAEFRNHVKSYGRTPAWKRHETTAILDLFAAIIKRASK